MDNRVDRQITALMWLFGISAVLFCGIAVFCFTSLTSQLARTGLGIGYSILTLWYAKEACLIAYLRKIYS